MGKKGQSILLFCLILSAVVITLLSSIMISLSSHNKSITRLKTRILSYQATIQISQIIQQGYETYKKYPTCTDGSSFTLTNFNVGPLNLCLPASEICINNQFRYCVAKDPNYLITEKIEPLSNKSYADNVPFIFDFSFLPKAFAQAVTKPWLPSLAAAPTATINQTGFPADMTTICSPAAGFNSICFKIRICTNGSTTCTNADDYYSTVVAVVIQK